jgi:hypothetical protein
MKEKNPEIASVLESISGYFAGKVEREKEVGRYGEARATISITNFVIVRSMA